MKQGLYYNRYQHSASVLGKIHNDIRNDYKQNENNTEAELIEKFLYAFKVYDLYNRNHKTFNKAIIEDELDEIMAYNCFNQNVMKRLKELGINLYKAEIKGQSNFFEQAYAIMQKEFYEQLSGKKDKEISDFWKGTILAAMPGSDNNGTYTLNSDNIKKNFTKILLRKMFTGNNEKEIPKNSTLTFTKKQQKVDNEGAIINYMPTNETEQVMKLIASKNFSLKNYRSSDKENSTLVAIGNTTPFRAIGSVLSTLVSNEEMLAIFFQGITSLQKNNSNSKIVAYHFNHLQLIYEYSGRGQIVFKDGSWVNAANVDYLIINDPTTTDIQVKSVKSLIYDFLHEPINARNSVFTKGIIERRTVKKGRHRYWN